jgi:hypothetical protein
MTGTVDELLDRIVGRCEVADKHALVVMKRAAKPVVALASVEHHFKAGKSNRYQHDTDAVDAKLTASPRLAPFLGKFRRIVNQAARERERQQPDRNIVPRARISNANSQSRIERSLDLRTPF